jgi:hypothetical protein
VSLQKYFDNAIEPFEGAPSNRLGIVSKEIQVEIGRCE